MRSQSPQGFILGQTSLGHRRQWVIFRISTSTRCRILFATRNGNGKGSANSTQGNTSLSPFYNPTSLSNRNTPKGQQLQIESTRFQNVIARLRSLSRTTTAGRRRAGGQVDSFRRHFELDLEALRRCLRTTWQISMFIETAGSVRRPNLGMARNHRTGISGRGVSSHVLPHGCKIYPTESNLLFMLKLADFIGIDYFILSFRYSK
jgi:hypothetical protein